MGKRMMNKSQALKYLEEAIDKMPHLKTLSWNNREYKLWRDGVLDVLEASFGSKSSEYANFLWACPIRTLGYGSQEEYLEDLQAYETALESTIQKYKILGIKEISKLQKVLQWVNSHLIQRLFQWIKSHKIPSIIITAIMLIAAIITIWGFVSGFFS